MPVAHVCWNREPDTHHTLSTEAWHDLRWTPAGVGMVFICWNLIKGLHTLLVGANPHDSVWVVSAGAECAEPRSQVLGTLDDLLLAKDFWSPSASVRLPSKQNSVPIPANANLGSTTHLQLRSKQRECHMGASAAIQMAWLAADAWRNPWTTHY